MRIAPSFAAAALLFLGILAACSSSTDPNAAADCHAGDQSACKCANGTTSLAPCVDGKVSTCACGDAGGDAQSGGDSGLHEGGASTSDAGFGQYLGPCNDTPDCPAGGTCFQFGTKGKVCTKTCTDSTQCPAPSPKCNPKMVCAPPD